MRLTAVWVADQAAGAIGQSLPMTNGPWWCPHGEASEKAMSQQRMQGRLCTATRSGLSDTLTEVCTGTTFLVASTLYRRPLSWRHVAITALGASSISDCASPHWRATPHGVRFSSSARQLCSCASFTSSDRSSSKSTNLSAAILPAPVSGVGIALINSTPSR